MSFVGLYGALALICLASAAVGWAALAVTGRREWSWLAPPLGLAVLVVLGATVLLPGRGVTASVVVGAAIVASVAYLARLRPGARGALRIGLPVAALTVVAASLPFVAGGGLDVMGSYVNNDLAFHLYNAEWLRSHEGIEPQQIADGYPIGPHGLVVAIAGLTGIALPEVWTALLIAVAVATALASLRLLGSLAAGARAPAALLVGLSYLGASFYVQSAFKETLMALFALGFALALRDAAGEGKSERIPAARLPGAALAPILFALACVAVYSVPGLGWPIGALAVWAAASLAPSRLRGLRAVIASRPSLAVVGLVALAAAMFVAVLAWDRATDFIGGREVIGPDALANLLEPIPPYEVLGLWLSSDYRIVEISFLGHGGIATWALAGLGALATAIGVIRLARRRELALLSALAAAAGAYLVGRYSLGPYVGSKALAVMAPLVMLTALVGLAPDAVRPGRWTAIVRVALLAAFMALALGSSYIALTGARLDRDDHEAQLGAFRDRVQGQTVLFLGSDEYAAWYLRGASVLAPTAAPPGLYLPVDNLGLPRTGERVDFDSYEPETLDGIDFVITADSSYMSAPPRNFKPVDSTESFTLYERVAPTPPRNTLEEGQLPAAVLDCDSRDGRKISREDGTAHLFPEPVLRIFGPLFDRGLQTSIEWVKEGTTLTTELPLTAGRWEISLQYHTLEPVVVDAPGLLHVELPPNSSRVGPYWRVGTVELDAPQRVAVTIAPLVRSGLRGTLSLERGRTGPETILGALVAVPVGGEREAVPLSEACGRLVDYYELGTPGR
jgi:hypothetical protein